jgi:putative PIN family toxin of toxin-antitoxin system
MQIMADANIIISAILFPKSVISGTIKHIVSHDKLVLSQYTIDEINEVFKNKFPHRIDEMEKFMEKLPYELFSLKKIDSNKYPQIRDIKDLPVLANAIESNVDLLITGDNDFDDIKIERPIIMKPRKYVNQYMR